MHYSVNKKCLTLIMHGENLKSRTVFITGQSGSEAALYKGIRK